MHTLQGEAASLCPLGHHTELCLALSEHCTPALYLPVTGRR